MDSSTQPRQREIVFCHGCENEWYRDEHGLICPECQSDFTEIVEANNDPRQDEQHIPADPTAPHQGDLYAPDPDEDDIDNIRLEETGPGRYRLRGTYRTDIPMGGHQQQQAGQGQWEGQGQGQGQGGAAQGLMGLVGNVLQGMLSGQQQGGQQQQQQGQPQYQNTPGRPASAPGSPAPDGQQGRAGNGTFVRHGHGPGFSYTIASSSNANFGGNLFPRNANGPQPYQGQPDHIEQMMQQMFANIGVMPGMRGGPGAHPFHGADDMHPGFGGGGGPFMMGGGGQGGMGPFANIFQLFGAPPGGVAGDAVYTQEALDRIMTQLMEQHQAGNAPGPASEAAIQALPKKVISAADQGDSGRADCSICMDEVEIGGTVTVLPCSHWFHHDCIKAWLTEHDTCPHCRQGIMPKDNEGGEAPRDQPRSPSQPPLHDMRSPEYARSAVPGAFPFPRQNSAGGGDGSAQNPYHIPESPNMNRRYSGGDRRAPSSASGSGGVFSRMRDAFGRGSSSQGENQGGGGNGGGFSRSRY